MQIKRYRGADMNEALQKVKADLGTDAIILSTRQVRSGGGSFGLFGRPMLEVTAARDAELEGAAGNGEEVPDPLAKGARKLKLPTFTRGAQQGGASPGSEFMRQMLARNRLETQQLLSPLQDEIQELKEVLHAVGDTHRGQLREESSIAQIRAELGEMRTMLHSLTQHSTGLRDANYPENLVVLYQQLIFNGIEEKFARRLIDEAAKNVPEKEAAEFTYIKIFLARMLMKIVKVTGGLRLDEGRQKIMALVGPTGVGKTTTVAKLASEQLLKHNKQVALITVDTFRIAAVEQLKTYARIMGLPITVVKSKPELRQAIENFSSHDLILIDTGGRSQRDDVQMSELRNLFGGDERIEVGLTLSATTKDSDLTDITRRFGELPLSSVFFTKLDESTAYGSLFNHAIRFKLPISYLATGQKVPEDIEVATKERLVDLLLDISAT